jgi:hypothetical protein
MKVELIKNNEGRAVGYRLIKELSDDPEVLDTIGALHYWGKKEANVKEDIQYAGRVFNSEGTTEITFFRKTEKLKRKEKK